jgi:hypothetical protein
MQIIIIIILGVVIAVIVIFFIAPGIKKAFPPAGPVVPPPAPAAPPPPPAAPQPPPAPTPGVAQWVPGAIADSSKLRANHGPCDKMHDLWYSAKAQWDSSTQADRDANRPLMNSLLAEMDKLHEALIKDCHEDLPPF